MFDFRSFLFRYDKRKSSYVSTFKFHRKTFFQVTNNAAPL